MTQAIHTLPPLRAVIAAHGLAAAKALGQHFLLDLNLTEKIVRAAGDLKNVHVCEVGPGPGGLTRALAESDAAHVWAIERDARCVAALQSLVTAAEGRLTLLEDDAMRVDYESLVPAPRALVANLPYNIATPLLVQWMKRAHLWRSLTLMFQKEVVDRIVATPADKAYGRLAVLVQSCATARRVMTLPARAFTPPPKVDSAVVHLAPHATQPAPAFIDTLETITAAAFGQRRKMLRTSLSALGGAALCARAEIQETLRAEDLSVHDFHRLVRAYDG